MIERQRKKKNINRIDDGSRHNGVAGASCTLQSDVYYRVPSVSMAIHRRWWWSTRPTYVGLLQVSSYNTHRTRHDKQLVWPFKLSDESDERCSTFLSLSLVIRQSNFLLKLRRNSLISEYSWSFLECFHEKREKKMRMRVTSRLTWEWTDFSWKIFISTAACGLIFIVKTWSSDFTFTSHFPQKKKEKRKTLGKTNKTTKERLNSIAPAIIVVYISTESVDCRTTAHFAFLFQWKNKKSTHDEPVITSLSGLLSYRWV